MEQDIRDQFSASAQTALASGELLAGDIARASRGIIGTIESGGKVLLCGNGGSASDALHFSAELLVRFERERRALPAVALTGDTATLTAIGNDYDFAQIFSRQVEALANEGDHLVVITTSGNSVNILEAARAAQRRGGITITAFTGGDGGKLASFLGAEDIELRVPSDNTARIQEVHAIIIHCLCRLIDNHFCG
tara:strand:- start:155 stop:736 length:582 start_codon:yes stop_codon:yes gene_type:complete